MGLYALGVLTGWKLKARFGLQKTESAPEAELRRMKAQQEAFRQLQNYSAETAYGIRGGILEEVED